MWTPIATDEGVVDKRSGGGQCVVVMGMTLMGISIGFSFVLIKVYFGIKT